MKVTWRRFPGFRPSGPSITSAAELSGLLTREASFLAQKSTIEYCRARAGLNWYKLFKEQVFLDALEVCRWEAFAAVLSDMMLVVEARLRPHATGAEERLAGRLAALHDAILASHAPPAHRAAGWSDAMAALPPRLLRAQLAPPQTPDRIAVAAGARIFEMLPIHPRLRGHDREMVINSIRFGMVGFNDVLGRRLALEPLIAELTRDG